MNISTRSLLIIPCFLIHTLLNGQFVSVGSGSYTTVFPGTDVAGRNTYPSGIPNVSGIAATKPVPTNDWWSSLIKNNFVTNLFNYPLAFKTCETGLVVCYITAPSGGGGSSQPTSDVNPIIVGVSNLSVSIATVSDYSDWTVTTNWNGSGHDFNATIGMGMPFIYFTKGGSDAAQVTVNSGTVTVYNEMLLITGSQNNSNYAVYAPTGSTWTNTGTTYTSSLNGKNYWSMAFLPPNASNNLTVADEYKKYAYVFPTDTKVSWHYNTSTSVVHTDFSVSYDVKEGTDTIVLQGLLPHQWDHLASGSPQPQEYSYPSIRGEIKTLANNNFAVENTFYGILPTQPYLDNYSHDFSPVALNEKINLIENDQLSTWTDTYNEGQAMNRLIQTARIADLMGNTEARDKIVETIKTRLENWLTAEPGEVAFLFYYDSTWTTLIGYPAGYGQDGNINDHHFHWGYFIHAAAFVEQFHPGWAANWGPMINMLVRDCANADRNDPLFPFLRNFSPYAGHCWADGFAASPFGNNQESSSESMQFNSSLIHWGTMIGNDAMRDLGIYLYTTEQTAIDEYWFDKNHRTLKPGYNYSMVSRIWGNGYDNQTFWTGDIAAMYGIEMYPMHGGSLYLGRDTNYVKSLWTEITNNTGILRNEANPNLWHDVMWEYLSFIDPQKGIELYNSYPDRSLKFGISDAQTYHWLHSMNALGRVDGTITADYPISAVFMQHGDTTYVAHNYGSTPIVVHFSDGYALNVPAYKMVTSRDIDVTGIISSSYPEAFPDGSVILTVTTQGSGISKVEFYDTNLYLDSVTSYPYRLTASHLQPGVHNFYAKVYSGNLFNVTNIIKVIVGGQVPYLGIASQIPGIIYPGYYDMFQGGIGQDICYYDTSPLNEGGDFRPGEYVDAAIDATEGAIVGYIDNGEWLDFTVNVQTSGYYNLSFRYSSGNTDGGGPFHLELDGDTISNEISVTSTGDWSTWSSKTVNNIPFTSGSHILRIVFYQGGYNLGKLTFTYQSALPYQPPIANAGANIIVVLPQSSTILNGSSSTVASGKTLTCEWSENYGPTIAVISDSSLLSPSVSGLAEGVYSFEIKINDGTYTDKDEVLVIVSTDPKLKPMISIVAPVNNSTYVENNTVQINTYSADLDGWITKVEFFVDSVKVGESTSFPFSMNWNALQGNHIITAMATDNDTLTTTSDTVHISVMPAPSCTGGPSSGDYTYMFSPDDTNPTLTFIPGQAGIGSPTCILYYGTSSGGPFPGYNVKPNIPYQITATKGTTLYFYYTYTGADGFEHNTSASKHTFVVGYCSGYVAQNHAPVANAGTDKTIRLPNNTISLNGSGTDEDGDTLTYLWTKKSGPDAVLSNVTSNILNVSGLVEGTYVFTLTVSDSHGASASDDVTVIVEQASETAKVTANSAQLFYPNPVEDILNLSFPIKSGAIILTDITGKQIIHITVSDETQKIDVSSLMQGIYIVTINNDGIITHFKIMKK